MGKSTRGDNQPMSERCALALRRLGLTNSTWEQLMDGHVGDYSLCGGFESKEVSPCVHVGDGTHMTHARDTWSFFFLFVEQSFIVALVRLPLCGCPT